VAVLPGQGNSSSSSSSDGDSSSNSSSNSSSATAGINNGDWENAELWHAFPAHGVALSSTDMKRLEVLTALDARLVRTADVLLDLDTVWLRSLLGSAHYRKRMHTVADTHAACGFAGMLPLNRSVADQVMHGSMRLWPS
jgi:hypothetical protein